MVAPNNSTLNSKSPFAVLSVSGPSLHSARRVSNASIDKLAAQSKRSPSAKRAPLKAFKKGATKAKAVRFSDATKVIARNVKTTTETDLPTWYQAQDYARLKYEILSSIQAITKVFNQEDTTPLDLEQHCLRGIETSISNDLYQRRKLRIKSTTKGVLEHQRLQRLVGVADPQALRAVSLKCSQDAQESAINVGMLDSQL